MLYKITIDKVFAANEEEGSKYERERTVYQQFADDIDLPAIVLIINKINNK